jgi:tripartite-type tricarboxylate transporter receptor subunit TctC
VTHYLILSPVLSLVSSAVLSLLALTLCTLPAGAQPAYPAKTVRVIVPYPPGGGNDIIGRAVADELTRRMGQTFFVDNRAGGSTIIGTEIAVRAPADGYHLFVASQTTFAIVPNLKAKVPYDPLRDFEPVSLLATQPYLIVVHPSLPVRTVKDLVAMAKAQPGKVMFASPTLGSGGHLSAEMFKAQTGVDMLNIPYKGAAPAVADLLGGQVPLMFATTSSVHAQVIAGKLRAVAITSAQRHTTLPNVPTVKESLPGYETTQWVALHGPRGMPQAVVERLHSIIASMAKAGEFRERMAAQGYDAESSTPQQLTARVRSEFDRFGKLIKSIGLKDES